MIFFRCHRLFTRAKHEGNARAINIAIANTDPRAGISQRNSEIRSDSRFADAALSAGNGDNMFDSRNAGCANSRAANTGRRRMDVDQDSWFRHAKSTQDALTFGLYCARNGRVIRCQDHLNAGVSVRRYDVLNQTERNNIAAESRIFDCAQCFPDLLPGDRHVRQSTLPYANGKTCRLVPRRDGIPRRYAWSRKGCVQINALFGLSTFATSV